MSQVREVFLSVKVAAMVVALALAVYGFFAPPFTDYEIRQSLVDTWQVNAIFTLAAVIAVMLPAFPAALLMWRGSRVAKRLAVASIALSLVTAAVLIGSHAALTERTTRITGQHFGGTLGLGLGPL